MKFQTVWSQIPDDNCTIFISFFAGPQYYRRAAERLRNTLDSYGAGYSISEFVHDSALDWPSICKAKITFVRRAIAELRRPVFWIDADTEIVRDPTGLLKINGADIACFLRSFGYLPTFDFTRFSRLFHPGYVLYGNTAKTLDLLDQMEKIAQEINEPVTDDYVLHEAIAQYGNRLSVHLMSPDYVAPEHGQMKPETVFLHGDSGNVATYKVKVLQHAPRPLQNQVAARVLATVAAQMTAVGKTRQALILLKQARKRAPLDEQLYLRELNARARVGHILKLRKLLAKGKADPALQSAAYSWDYERLALIGLHGRADRLLEDLAVTENPNVANALQSRQYRFGLDARARKRWLNPVNWVSGASRVKLWWWQRPYPGNWGDILNPYLIEKLTGIPPKYRAHGQRLLAIGSVIRWADDKTNVWGSGLARANETIATGTRFHAVRGPLTRAIILAGGGQCPEVYGDPALLLPYVYTPVPLRSGEREPAHELGLILHHNHAVDDLSIGRGVKVIPIQRIGYDGIEAFLNELASCRTIMSTSLHGLIAAHAYGIPTSWATLVGPNSKAVPGDGMKFLDYYQSVGLDGVTEPLQLRQGHAVDDSLAGQCTELPSFNKLEGLRADLLSTAPFRLLPEFQINSGK
jgi:Polysaccharide pyruvyl transferase